MAVASNINTHPPKPLIPESSTSESTNVEVTLNDLRDRSLEIPDYQRDSNQWDDVTKSLLVESVINNLSIPAFFFEVVLEESAEKNYVIDGQQRLTTLEEFYRKGLRLVKYEDAKYLSPNSVHYADKTFDELPPIYQLAFKKYRLTVIKLRNLDSMRLEVFRRINQGGTPLSGQDIRLAVYGDRSPTVMLIRLAGVYDPRRPAAQRFIEVARSQYQLDDPWTNEAARGSWKAWWEDKEIARGQTASEMFLWALLACQYSKLGSLLRNDAAVAKLNCRFSGAIEEALDVYCAQSRCQDLDTSNPPVLMTFQEMKERFFPYFQLWIDKLLNEKGPYLPVTKHRAAAAVIGAAYQQRIDCERLQTQQWTNLVEFIRRSYDMAKKMNIELPASKGRWDGTKGYMAQFEAIDRCVRKCTK